MTDEELQMRGEQAWRREQAWRKVLVQASDYSYEGWLVSVFKKRRNQVRCVVEDDNGRLFIHNAGQLTAL